MLSLISRPVSKGPVARPATSRKAWLLSLKNAKPCSRDADPREARLRGRDERQPRSALLDIHVVAQRLAMIQLTRAADLELRIGNHLFPLRNPTDGSADRKYRREHRGREPHCLKNDARIESHIRKQLLVGEIVVRKRRRFQIRGDLQRRVVLDTEQIQDLVGGL